MEAADEHAKTATGGETGRLRTRVALSVPLIVTSLDDTYPYQATGDAIDVSSSGVQIRLRSYARPGTRVRLDVLHSDQVTEGRIVRAQFDGTKYWMIGVQLLDPTGNVWKLAAPPADWIPTRPSSRYDQWTWAL